MWNRSWLKRGAGNIIRHGRTATQGRRGRREIAPQQADRLDRNAAKADCRAGSDHQVQESDRASAAALHRVSRRETPAQTRPKEETRAAATRPNLDRRQDQTRQANRNRFSGCRSSRGLPFLQHTGRMASGGGPDGPGGLRHLPPRQLYAKSIQLLTLAAC